MADYAFERINTVDSTNTELKRRINASFGMKTSVLIADEQTAGRGRRGRVWLNTDGALLMSICIPLKGINPDLIPLISLTAAIAANEAIADLRADKHKMTRNTGIKWPNDILCQGRKLTGILTEMSAEMDRINYVVIGIGINVNILQDDFPEELREKAGSMAMVKGEFINRPGFFREVLRELDICYREICNRGFGALMDKWRSLSVTLGQEINVIGINESFSGKAIDIDDDGALLVETEGAMRRVLAGDVSIRPKLQ